MNIAVRYLAQMRGLAGRSLQSVDLPGPCTVAELVAVLVERQPSLKTALLDGAGRPRPGVLVFVGDEQVGPDRPLRDGDEVSFLTPIAGGSVHGPAAPE